MTRPVSPEARAWMAQWRSAASALARVRATELQAVDLWRVADELEDALLASMRREPAACTSGLVEQQRIFARARRT